MSVITKDWCRIEGAIVKDTKKAYGYTLSSDIKNDSIFYGTAGVQIYNRSSIILGVVFKVVKIKDLTGYTTVPQIDANYSAFRNALNSYSTTVGTISTSTSTEDGGAQLYTKEIAISESSVIFYAESTSPQFTHYAVIYIDKSIAPPMLGITAKYVGNSVPVDTAFNPEDLQVYAQYEDGNTSQIVTGYNITPADMKITKVGSNVFNITYIDDTGDTLGPVPVTVQGVKRLLSIRGVYDGPSVYGGQTVERRFLTIIAEYSDGSTSVITNYGFPNGNKMNINETSIVIQYNGQRCNVTIPTYEISSSRLMAFYTGPAIEVDVNNPKEFDTSKTRIQIYYASADGLSGKWETIDSSLCTFTPMHIDHEGSNLIKVTYTGRAGQISCDMIVNGVSPIVVMTRIEVTYTGGNVVCGKPFSLERLNIKGFLSDGSTVNIKNGYTVDRYIVNNVGDNQFLCKYTFHSSDGNDVTLESYFSVNGIEKEATTDTGYTPITLQNHYPEATRYNNRWRGPAESVKHEDVNRMIFDNILALYKIYGNIEKNYNAIIEKVEGQNAIKHRAIHLIHAGQDVINDIRNDKRFIP